VVGMRHEAATDAPWRGLSISFGIFLFMLAVRVYLGRFDRLYEDHTIFAGVTYTDAHVALTGLLIVSIALAAGGLAALLNAISAPRIRWLIAAVVPAAVLYVLVGVLGSYVDNFIVK